MDPKLLKRFAEQDLTASRAVVQEAERKITAIIKAAESQGTAADNSPKMRAFKDLAKKPFRLRVDYRDADTNLIEKVYLTTALQNLLVDSVKIASWTSPLATLRHLDVGDDDIIRKGGTDHHVTVELKGTYGESAPDIKNATYLLRNETLVLDSALGLLGQSETPLEDHTAPEPAIFGLKELVLQTDTEQDNTMRFPMKGFLRIEGVPGSGKTTVALQRIAYLIARQFEELHLPVNSDPIFSESKTLVLVLNEVLEVYLRRLLDELNISSVDIVSFNRFLRERLFSQTDYLSDLKIVPSSQSPPWLELTKTRFEILQRLNQFVRHSVADHLKPALSELLAEFRSTLPARFKALAGKVDQVVNEFLSHLQGSLSLKTLVAGISGIESSVPKSGKTRNSWDHLNDELVKTLKSVANPFSLLRGFYASREYENHLKNAIDLGWIKKSHRQQIRDGLSEGRDQGTFTENDLALAAIIRLWFVSDLGSLTLSKRFEDWLRPLPGYSHIVIDEIQDFTEIQTRFIYYLMQDEFKCITAVGDLTQKLRWPEGLESWERTGLFAGGHEVTLGVFKTNYRQTYQLGKVAYEYYKHAFDKNPPFVPVSKMEGLKPGLTVVYNLEREVASMAEKIRAMVRRLMDPTIAVIIEDDTSREEYWRRLVTLLSDTIQCRLSRGRDLTRLGVLHVVSLDDVKGLEFDSVIISDANKILHMPKTESAARTGKNRLYVAITRARKELHIFCYRNIPAILWQVRRDLAITNTYVCKSCKTKNRISECLGEHTDGLICKTCREYETSTRFVSKDVSVPLTAS